MKKIMQYESEDGNIYNHEHDALLADADHALKNVVKGIINRDPELYLEEKIKLIAWTNRAFSHASVREELYEALTLHKQIIAKLTS